MTDCHPLTAAINSIRLRRLSTRQHDHAALTQFGVALARPSQGAFGEPPHEISLAADQPFQFRRETLVAVIRPPRDHQRVVDLGDPRQPGQLFQPISGQVGGIGAAGGVDHRRTIPANQQQGTEYRREHPGGMVLQTEQQPLEHNERCQQQRDQQREYAVNEAAAKMHRHDMTQIETQAGRTPRQQLHMKETPIELT